MFRLMLVTDRARSPLPITEAVQCAVGGGVDAVQLRERDLEGRQLFDLATELRRITRGADVALVINHRVDVALAVDADGVHLGWRSLPVREVRKLAGERLRIGVSCHNASQLRSARDAGADYASLGPVFSTPSKTGLLDPLGPERTRSLVADAGLPVIAIGGINTENVGELRDLGLAGIAVISEIMASANPQAATRDLRQRLMG